MARARIVIEFADRPHYDIRIGGGVIRLLPDVLRARGAGAAGRCLVVCDSESAGRCLPSLRGVLDDAGLRAADIELPAVGPERAWECVAELHRALAGLRLPDGAPVLVCAGVEASETAAFALATYGQPLACVPVPASVAAALHLAGVDRVELDAGHPAPLVARSCPASVLVDTDLLACASAEEEALGLDELSRAAGFCDASFQEWLGQNAAALAAHDDEACTLAMAQVLAARADRLGQGIAARLRG